MLGFGAPESALLASAFPPCSICSVAPTLNPWLPSPFRRGDAPALWVKAVIRMLAVPLAIDAPSGNEID